MDSLRGAGWQRRALWVQALHAHGPRSSVKGRIHPSMQQGRAAGPGTAGGGVAGPLRCAAVLTVSPCQNPPSSSPPCICTIPRGQREAHPLTYPQWNQTRLFRKIKSYHSACGLKRNSLLRGW